MLELPSASWTVAGLSLTDRDLLARFWPAPEDLLPSLWASPVGESTKHLVKQLDPHFTFSAEQIALRNAIGLRLQGGFQAPMAIQLLIVNFLYSPPGLLRINDPQANLPAWLLADYQALYEGSPTISSGPADAPANQTSSQNLQAPSTNVPQPDWCFPCTLGTSWRSVQLNRLLGLSNLYYIDPEDQEILTELRQVRFFDY